MTPPLSPTVLPVRAARWCGALAVASIAIAASLASAGGPQESRRLPVIYPVPLKGQMGTDIHPSIYEEVVKDAQRVRPDLIVFILNSADINEVFYLADDDRAEFGLGMLGEFRSLVIALRDGLREFDQAIWVEDSVGFGTLMALSWPTMYMKPRGRLWGLQRVADMARGWQDPDVAAKMMAAWTGIGKGFLEKGGYPLELGEAMMRPEHRLSASFQGRKVNWSLDTSGHWLVDGSDEATTNIRAEQAEDLGICAGLAESLDDVAFLNGWREYEVADSGQKIVEKYIEDWRRVLDRTIQWQRDAEQARGWAQGGDAVKYLGQVRQNYERILAAMRQYPAVEIRWRTQFGLDRLRLEVALEQLREQLRGLRGGSRGGAGGGGGMGGGSGGRGLGGGN